MAVVALVISLFIAAMGALGVASPARLLGVVRSIQTPKGLYLAAALRVALGLALFLAAPDSRAPEIIRILGVLVFVLGLLTPFFGLERFRRLLDWWSARGSGFIRVWAAVAFAFGLLLAYAVFP